MERGGGSGGQLPALSQERDRGGLTAPASAALTFCPGPLAVARPAINRPGTTWVLHPGGQKSWVMPWLGTRVPTSPGHPKARPVQAGHRSGLRAQGPLPGRLRVALTMAPGVRTRSSGPPRPPHKSSPSAEAAPSPSNRWAVSRDVAKILARLRTQPQALATAGARP